MGTTSRVKSAARSLARNAMKEASELTVHVLEGGRSPRLPVRKKKGRARPARRKTGEDVGAEAMVAPPGLRADVTPQLRNAAPAFGDVLRSLAHAAAVTQTALDDAALESLETLATEQVRLPVLVEQELDDAGIPTTATIRTEPVPLTSIIPLSMYEVTDLTVRMDVRVESFDATSGIKFNQNMASAGVSYTGHKFGFGTSVNNTNINAQFSNLSDFSSGSVLVSMDIADRTGFQIPTPLEYGVGANLIIRVNGPAQTVSTSPGPPAVTTVTRAATLAVTQIKKDGSVQPLTHNDYGVSVPAGVQYLQGVVSRNPATPAEPYEERTIFVTWGQLTKELKLFL